MAASDPRQDELQWILKIRIWCHGVNQTVYGRLRYGVPVKVEAAKVTETVHLIDWVTPENNDFAIAEEVTLKGGHERRPDLVLYVNGIAVAVIELKSSKVTMRSSFLWTNATAPRAESCTGR